MRLLDEGRQDARHAGRLMRRHPSFAAAAVLSLALGIGANTALFSVIDAALLHPLPYPAPERLVAIHSASPTSTTNSLSYPNFVDIRARTRSLEATAAWRIEMFTLAGTPQAERVIGGRVSASYFTVLGVPPLLGRTFGADEDRPGGSPVLLLGEPLWRRRFAADPHIVGRAVTLDGVAHTVIGVMPAHVSAGVGPRLFNDVFLPIGQDDDELLHTRHVHAAAAIGRLHPDVRIDEARVEMDGLARSLAAAFPQANADMGLRLVPLEDDVVGGLRPTLLLLLGAVACVLLIACANVSSLILARFTSRSQEFAVRAALGAGRGRIVRQALTEALCLAFAGGALGVALAAWGTRAVLSVLPSALPEIVTVDLNGRVLLVAAGAALASGLLAALVPAVRAAGANVSGRRSAIVRGNGARRHHTHHVFLATQVALSLVLLVTTGLMARSLARVSRVDPGFDPRGIVTFMSGLPSEYGDQPDLVRTTVDQVAGRLAAVGGVDAASAVVGALPYTGNNNQVDFWLDGEPRPIGSDTPMALYAAVGPDYFRTMSIPLLTGRAFTPFDTSPAPRVAIVDEEFAAGVFPGQDPIGRRIHLDGTDGAVEIAGVVGHVKHWGLDERAVEPTRRQVYVPLAQLPDSLAALAASRFSVVVRSSRPPADALGDLRASLRAFDAGQVMINETAMPQGIARSLSGRRFSLVLLASFALIAVILSAVGINGLASFLATTRTREIGVRMALGAQPRDVLRTLLGSIGRAVAIGMAVGLLAALGAAQLIAAMLFETSPEDPITLAGVAALLAGVAVMASYLPARRALRVDPVSALRQE